MVSIGLMRQRRYLSRTLPKLDVVSIDQTLGATNRRLVIVTDQRLEALDTAVVI